MHYLDLLLTVAAGVLLVPVTVFTVECAAALLPRPRRADPANVSPTGRPGVSAFARPRTAVLVPAHNEEAGIATTLQSIAAQLRDGDRLLVVADNCTDATAPIARTAVGSDRLEAVPVVGSDRLGTAERSDVVAVASEGLEEAGRDPLKRVTTNAAVEVVERRDPERRGKGYALDFGVKALEADPPEVVVFVDADCRLEPGALDALVSQAAATGRPAQARYLLDAPPGASPRATTSALAFLVKNFVRPAGLNRLGLPCLLTGAGMAFPWGVIQSADLATDHLSEDMQLGIDLAIAGRAPRFCPSAAVTGRLPDTSRAAAGQRRRWEHGHLKTLLTQVPRLFWRAIAGSPKSRDERRATRAHSPPCKGHGHPSFPPYEGGVAGVQAPASSGLTYRRDALALALELCVPPLSLLVLLLVVAMAGTAAHFGAFRLPALLLIGGLLAVFLATLAVWMKFGRRALPMTALLAAPLYVLWKVPLYVAYLVRPQKEWVRTARNRPAA